MEFRVTDREWEFLSRHLSQLPARAADSKGRPRADDRALFEGILWVIATGSRWRDIPPPPHYPAKSSCYRRFSQWCRDGSWARIQRALVRMLGSQGKIDWSEGFIDGTQVKAKKGALRLARLPAHDWEERKAA
jgi:transposase